MSARILPTFVRPNVLLLVERVGRRSSLRIDAAPLLARYDDLLLSLGLSNPAVWTMLAIS